MNLDFFPYVIQLGKFVTYRKFEPIYLSQTKLSNLIEVLELALLKLMLVPLKLLLVVLEHVKNGLVILKLTSLVLKLTSSILEINFIRFQTFLSLIEKLKLKFDY